MRYGDSSKVQEIVHRVSDLVDIPPHHSESMQVVHYAETQEYASFRWLGFENRKGSSSNRNGGQRVLTALMYLNDVAGGGGTSFPKLDLEVEAKPGRLVIFHNIEDEATRTSTCVLFTVECQLVTVRSGPAIFGSVQSRIRRAGTVGVNQSQQVAAPEVAARKSGGPTTQKVN